MTVSPKEMSLSTRSHGTYPIVIVDSDYSSVSRIRRFIEELGNHAEVAGTAPDYEAGLELIALERPRVVILEIGDDIDEGIVRIKEILERFRHTVVFATCASKSSEDILKVMRAGADEYILRPVTESDLDSALQKHGRVRLSHPAMEMELGKIFTLFSPKGGVGVTTVALNLAVHLHTISRKPTLIIDLDLNAGDISTFLNLEPSYTITDVTLNMSRLDKSFLQGVLTKHSSGVYILAEPYKIEEAVGVRGADVKKLVNMLRTMFYYIVIDTESAIDERSMAALKIADCILMLFVMSFPGIKNIQKYRRYFESNGYDMHRIKLVVNRYQKKGDISISDAEKALNCPIYWSLPNDYEASLACLNKGMPLNAGSPRTQLNKSIHDMAKDLSMKLSKGELE